MTGRERRCGWLDLVALRYAVRLNGITSIALTKLDVLSAFDELPVCTRYQLRDGTRDGRVPAAPERLPPLPARLRDARRLGRAARRRRATRRRPALRRVHRGRSSKSRSRGSAPAPNARRCSYEASPRRRRSRAEKLSCRRSTEGSVSVASDAAPTSVAATSPTPKHGSGQAPPKRPRQPVHARQDVSGHRSEPHHEAGGVQLGDRPFRAIEPRASATPVASSELVDATTTGATSMRMKGCGAASPDVLLPRR